MQDDTGHVVRSNIGHTGPHTMLLTITTAPPIATGRTVTLSANATHNRKLLGV